MQEAIKTKAKVFNWDVPEDLSGADWQKALEIACLFFCDHHASGPWTFWFGWRNGPPGEFYVMLVTLAERLNLEMAERDEMKVCGSVMFVGRVNRQTFYSLCMHTRRRCSLPAWATGRATSSSLPPGCACVASA
jgi:hypothetical protein